MSDNMMRCIVGVVTIVSLTTIVVTGMLVITRNETPLEQNFRYGRYGDEMVDWDDGGLEVEYINEEACSQ